MAFAHNPVRSHLGSSSLVGSNSVLGSPARPTMAVADFSRGEKRKRDGSALVLKRKRDGSAGFAPGTLLSWKKCPGALPDTAVDDDEDIPTTIAELVAAAKNVIEGTYASENGCGQVERIIADKADAIKKRVSLQSGVAGDQQQGRNPETDDRATGSLKFAAEEGFDLRGSVGQRFTKSLKKDPQQNAIYVGLKSRQEKADFRKLWASKKYDEATASVGKSKQEGITIQEGVTGEFYSFGALVVKYGGWNWEPAVQGAKNTAFQCQLLGGKWGKVDPWSKLVFYFVTSERYSDMFNKEWKTFEETMDAAGGPPNSATAAQPSVPPVAVPPVAVPPPLVPAPEAGGAGSGAKAKAKAKAKAVAVPKCKVQGGKPPTKDKTTEKLQQLVADAGRLKKKLINVRGEGQQLLDKFLLLDKKVHQVAKTTR